MTKIGSEISRLSAIRLDLLDNARASQNLNNDKLEKNFAENIQGAMRDVANAQETSANLSKNYELGKEHDLTKVMVSQNISSLAFQMTLNVRNKVLSAYKDIMNIPV
jgi:flagellar hook-basal body complex protein FliE